MIELIDQVSDIMGNTFRQLAHSTPSKELVLQENTASQAHSYKKVRPSLTKKIRMPTSEQKVKTEERKHAPSTLEADGPFLEDAFAEMHEHDIRM